MGGFGGGGGFRGGDNGAGAVVVTLEEMEVGIKLFSVGEGEDLLTFGQINLTNVVITAMNVIK